MPITRASVPPLKPSLQRRLQHPLLALPPSLLKAARALYKGKQAPFSPLLQVSTTTITTEKVSTEKISEKEVGKVSTGAIYNK